MLAHFAKYLTKCVMGGVCPLFLSTIMSTPKKDSAKAPAKSAAKPAAKKTAPAKKVAAPKEKAEKVEEKKAPVAKKPAPKAEKKPAKAVPVAKEEKKPAKKAAAPKEEKKAAKPASAPKAEKKPAKKAEPEAEVVEVTPAAEPEVSPLASQPDAFEIMMGLVPEPVEEPEAAAEEPEVKESKSKEKKTKEKKSKHFTLQVSAAEMNEFFADDATLKTAFKALLAIAKKNNGYVTSEDIENSLPPDEAEDNDQARLFERLHEVGVEVRDEDEYAVKPLSAD